MDFFSLLQPIERVSIKRINKRKQEKSQMTWLGRALMCGVSALSLGPGRTGQIFVYFAKKSVINSLRQVRPVIFRSTKFCQGLPNFKDAVVLPRSRTNFCQA